MHEHFAKQLLGDGESRSLVERARQNANAPNGSNDPNGWNVSHVPNGAIA
jgi:hypothetical protein